MAFTQDLFSSRRNFEDGDTRIGEEGRIWYDSNTNTMRVSDGSTPGGIVIGGSGGGSSYTLPTASTTTKGGIKIDGSTITISGSTISVGTIPYSSITDTPTIPTTLSQLTNNTGFITNVSLTWSNVSGKPNFATVATSGSYTDLANKPTLFSGSYLDLTNKPVLFSGNYTDLTNKPTLFSGSYTDLTNKPTIPTVPTTVSSFTNDSGYITTSALTGYATVSNLQTLDANVGAYESWANASIQSTNANITAANSVIAMQTTWLGNLQANVYSNTNVASYIAGNITAGRIFISNSYTSTSYTTGALQVAGGVGIAGNLYIGSNASPYNGTYNSISLQGLMQPYTLVGSDSSINNTILTGPLGQWSISSFFSGNVTRQVLTKYGNGDILLGHNYTGYLGNIILNAGTGTNTGVNILTGSSSQYTSRFDNSGSLSTGAVYTSGNIVSNVSPGSVGLTSITANVGGAIYSITNLVGGVLGSIGVGWGTPSNPGQFMAISASGGKNFINTQNRDFYINDNTGTAWFYLTQANGNVTLNSNTISSNTTTGALVMAGGAGIGGNVNIGGNLSVTGNIFGNIGKAGSTTVVYGPMSLLPAQAATIHMNNNTIDGVDALAFSDPGNDGRIDWGMWKIWDSPDDLITNTTGNLQIVFSNSNLGVNTADIFRYATFTKNGQFVLPNTSPATSSTSTTTGALVITGGAGIGGNVNIGNNLTAANITIGGAVSVNNSATDKYIGVGSRGQLFDDGNFHIHTNSGSLWLNSLDGSDIRLGTQTNTGSSSVIVNTSSVGHSFFTKVQTPSINTAFGTSLAMDNLNVRVNLVSGSTGQLQASAVSGSFACYTTVISNVAGSALVGDTNSNGITFTAGTWASIGGTKNIASGGDMITVHLMDTTNNRMYRITAMHGNNTTGAYISIERMA